MPSDPNKIIPEHPCDVKRQAEMLNLYRKFLRVKPGDDLSAEESACVRVTTCRAVLADIAQDFIAGAMLSQLHYWCFELAKNGKPRTSDPHGWLAKTDTHWYEEMRLTPAEVKAALLKLEAVGVIEVCLRKWAGHPTRHIRLKIDVLLERWGQVMRNELSRPKTKRTRADNAERNQKRAQQRVSKSDTSPDVSDSSSPYLGETNPLITGMDSPNYEKPFPYLRESSSESPAEGTAEGETESVRNTPRATRGPQAGAETNGDVSTRNRPSLPEAVAFFQSMGLSEAEATLFHNRNEACGWIDRIGHPLRDWRKTARAWRNKIPLYGEAAELTAPTPPTPPTEPPRSRRLLDALNPHQAAAAKAALVRRTQKDGRRKAKQPAITTAA